MLATLYQPYVVTEETFGIVTTIMGVCGRRRKSHSFQVLAEKVGTKIRDSNMHGYTSGRLYSRNYQLTAAMQQMGVGTSAMETLQSFLELPNQSALIK